MLLEVYSMSFTESFFFFFQAEDGIRDVAVTGVQTCALPIYDLDFSRPAGERRVSLHAYARVSLAGQYTMLGHDGAGRFVALTARIENLLNDRAPEIAGFLPRGRTILAGARVGVGP